MLLSNPLHPDLLTFCSPILPTSIPFFLRFFPTVSLPLLVPSTPLSTVYPSSPGNSTVRRHTLIQNENGYKDLRGLVNRRDISRKGTVGVST